MKRVLHISKYYYPFRGGTEQIAQDCVRFLGDEYEQKVFCFNDGKEDVKDIVDGVDVERAGCFAKISSQSLSRSYGRMLKKAIYSFKPDYIIFHYPNPFAASYLLRYIPKDCKLIIYWHLDIVKQRILKNLFIVQNKRLVNRADRIIATSPPYIEGSKYLSSVRDKCIVVPNCINAERLQVNQKVTDRAEEIKEDNKGKTICLSVGRHTEYKGFKYLIQAAHLLDDTYQFFITGKGEETDRLIEEAGDDSKIHFLGIVDDTELKAYMSAMDIFCFPSITKNEAFGLALAEGMYFGKPAVTFTIPGSGVNYVSIDGITGIEVPNRDIEKYADAIKHLAADKTLRDKLGRAGKERVEENFLDTQFRDNIVKAISEV